MSMQPHGLGFCVCRSHSVRQWNRPEHWTQAEVVYLEARFGLSSDEALARHLGRSVAGLRLKAKRLGLRKRDAGLTAAEVARLLGIPDRKVPAAWHAAGLLRGRRGWRQGTHRVHLFREADVNAFIVAHGQHLDADRVPPDSPFAALARANRWLSLPEVHRLTGRQNVIEREVAAGLGRAARRGSHWYIRAADVPLIRSLPPALIAESWWRRQSVLERNRNRLKGVGAG